MKHHKEAHKKTLFRQNMTYYWSAFVVFATLLQCREVSTTSYYDVINIHDHLLKNYSKDVAPILNQSDSVNIQIHINLKSISDFDDATGLLKVMAGLQIVWTDELLVWQPSEFNAFTISMPMSNIWRPILYLMNSGDSNFLLEFGDDTRTTVSHNGNTSVMIGRELTTRCEANILFYPEDHKDCEIAIYPFEPSISFKVTSSIDIGQMRKNSLWELISSTVETVPHPYPNTVLKITLKRRSGFLFVGLLLPMILLGFVNLFAFVLPVESGERVSFCMTVLLACAVFFSVVADKMPPNGMQISHICVYLGLLLFYSSFIAFLNIFVIRKHYTGHMPIFGTLNKLFGSKKVNDIPNVIYEDCEKKDVSSEKQIPIDETGNISKKDWGKINWTADSIGLFCFAIIHFFATMIFLIRVLFAI